MNDKHKKYNEVMTYLAHFDIDAITKAAYKDSLGEYLRVHYSELVEEFGDKNPGLANSVDKLPLEVLAAIMERVG